MTDHLITDIVGSYQGPDDTIHVNWTDVTKGCVSCMLLEPGERPATECPAERWNLTIRLARALGRLQVAPAATRP